MTNHPQLLTMASNTPILEKTGSCMEVRLNSPKILK